MFIDWSAIIASLAGAEVGVNARWGRPGAEFVTGDQHVLLTDESLYLLYAEKCWLPN
ncbi:hypothetical protein LF929_007290 [Dickeya oryzae]|uniref:Uncharacterized protein n=1 Tax=Dickeya oryzae TaxID=1240404 RepID=A0AB39IW14_9GAMM|nr:hypothetical protein [Dickeya oryzae]MCA6991744.1 hypothetical protein [Dickeya oryzae]